MARQPRTPRASGARAARRTAVAQAFDALTVEGSLIPTAQLALIATAQAEGQDESAYGVPKGLTLRDEIPRFFRIAQALWKDLDASETTSRTATVAFTERLMRDVLGFTDVGAAPLREHDGRIHPVTLEALGGRVPMVVTPPSDPLDRPSPALVNEGRRTSAALALQDWLNASDSSLWGLSCNGEKLRLVRDNPSLTRPAYIEADLRRMFEGDAFADFTALWLLLHASRFGAADAPATDCALERWRESGQKAGVAARDRLRDGVEEALRAFGTGFLSHPANSELRRKLATKELDLLDFHGLLLRLVYRLIFLLAAEDRNLLHPPGAPVARRILYAEGYSVSRLRTRSAKRAAWDAHDDLWDGLQIAFLALARGEPSLALPALAGLFIHGGLGELETCALPNRALMRAIYRLAWLKEGGAVVPVNWRDMETEELGSVYESLLELTPRLTDDGRGYGFAEGAETKGNQRKTTGSYYTPDSLVQVLLDSSLDPVLDRVERESETPAEALLGITVIDPACGSGHFLLAAARRIATRVARLRAEGAASADDYRHALRDVVRACIYGVDRNPMAVELTKVALWIETVEPGKPLGFLDASIRCGDALLGVFDLSALAIGIPDAAYNPLAGDDKAAARQLLIRNREERKGQGSLDFSEGGGRLPAAAPLVRAANAWRALPEDRAEEIAAKRARFEAYRADPNAWSLFIACDLYTAAFLAPKVAGSDATAGTSTIVTTSDVWRRMAGGQVFGPREAKAVDLAREANAFHWPLEFPDVMALGGFDCVLGNPPWERIKLQEQEFFAPREPEIAAAVNAAARGRMIAALSAAGPGSRERAMFESFEQAKRSAEASSVFARVPIEQGGRFPLTGRGDVNTYALFAELFTNLVSLRGLAGVIVPTGLATDLSTSTYFRSITSEGRLIRLISFENEEFLFSEVHNATKFAIFVTGPKRSEGAKTTYTFLLRNTAQLADPRRTFEMTRDDLFKLNPNTGTALVLRSKADAELAKSLHERWPILWSSSKECTANPWEISFKAMFHMSSDSGQFVDRPSDLPEQGDLWPTDESAGPLAALFEGKMFHHFDHRAGSYRDFDVREGKQVKELPRPGIDEYSNPHFEVQPRYYVSNAVRLERLVDAGWDRGWLLGWRDITGSTVFRTTVAAILPDVAVGHNTPVMMSSLDAKYSGVLVGLLSSLVFDYLVRLKIGGLHLTYSYLRQIPAPPPSTYTAADLAFIVERVLELTYTSWSLQPFACDLGYDGPPFPWDEDRRARLRAELDAWYARAYGLTRNELRYVLDPADVMGSDYPSETFRVLKTNELRRFGEYRTQRLVLDAWDRQEAAGQATAEPTTVARLHPSSRSQDEWARPAAGATELPPQTRAQIAAVLKAINGPTPEREVRLAALYALEPNLLTARLGGEERSQWIRVVGAEATPAVPGVLTFGLGGAAGWSEALRQLTAQNALVIDTAHNTWSPGPGLATYYTEGWPERAGFALDVAARVLATGSTGLTVEESRGLAAIAA